MSIFGALRSQLWNARRKLRDRRAVSRIVDDNPWLRDVVRHMEHSTRMLTPRYLQYTNFVSNPGHALSLEACALVHSLCHVMQPRHVMDLGSGFSSYVFRSYQAEAEEEVRVRSVDDSPEWLQRTNDYLKEKGLSTDDLVTLEDLGPSDVGAYDLVLYDMGTMETRHEWLSAALSFPRPERGVLVIDDCHFEDFAAQVSAQVRSLGAHSIDLGCLTRDQFGRFEILVTALPASDEDTS